MAKKKDNLIEVTTKTGFKCKIDKERLDDWQFAKAALKASQSGEDNLRLALYMIEHMMSETDAERLEEHVKDTNGRIPTTKILEEVEDIFTNLNQAKNPTPSSS